MKFYFYILIFIIPLTLRTQDLKPEVHTAKNGFYLDISNKIEKKGFYKIYRKDSRDTTFKEIAILQVPDKFENFYNLLNLANSKNPIYDFPEQKILPQLWEIAIRTQLLDSILIYGRIPYFQEALGCGFYDDLVENGISYVYKIQLFLDNQLKNEYITPPLTFNQIIPDCKTHFSSFDAKEKYVKLSLSSHKSEKPFKIKLYRSVYLQTDFMELMPNIIYNKEGDSIFARVIDTTVVKGIIYNYFAIPIDLYGNYGVPSDTVKVINSFKNADSYIETIRTKSIDSLNAIQISWKCDVPKYLRSINVFRSESYDGNYKLIGNALPTDTMFLDNQVNPIITYYYYLIINDVFGESTRSPRTTGMLQANKKAEIPLDFKLSQDNGNIILKWKRPTSDTRGYYVFRTTALENDTLLQISDLILNSDLDVTYVDSLKNINSPVLGYTVKSVNTSYNISDAAEIEYINPQMKRVISTPMNLRTLYQNGNVLLTWNVPLNNDLEVLSYNIYRKLLKSDGTDSTNFQQLFNSIENAENNYFSDSSITEGNTYLYAVEAISLDGNKSSLSAPASIYLPKTKPLSIQSIFAGISNTGVFLQWDKSLQTGIKTYNIYRLKENEKPLKIASVDANTIEYFDNFILEDTPIYYAITCVNEKGDESEIIEWTKIVK